MEVVAFIISAISLLIATISFFISLPAQHLQNKVNELEVRIKEYELVKIEEEKSEMNRSCVEARIINVSSGKYKLKIWNSGCRTVRNVSAKLSEDANIIILNNKMPYELLEPRKGFDASLIVHFGSARKFIITTEWENENGSKQSKEQMGDI